MAKISPFIRREGQLFYLEGNPYFFLGTNLWYGMNLGSQGEGGDRGRLLDELDHLYKLGINNLRIMGCTEGPDIEKWRMLPSSQPQPGVFREEILEGLDFLLDEMAKRKMKAVICLGNFWPWSGGMAQYINWSQGKSIPYPPPAKNGNWATYQAFTSAFYSDKEALQLYANAVRKVVSRVNSINGLPYAEDPAIMSWQLANEPRPILNKKAYRKWIKASTELIRSLDSQHLISIGSEGRTSSKWAGTRFSRDHRIDGVSYSTAHLWIQNWGWYDPERSEETYPSAWEKARGYLDTHIQKAKKLGMPLVLEEFGISRDMNSHDPASTVEMRNKYYRDLFELAYTRAFQGDLSGINFWAWGGKGRPRQAKAIWKGGDSFIGDPPHEYQGWYSVYDHDVSSLELIREYAGKFNNLCKP